MNRLIRFLRGVVGMAKGISRRYLHRHPSALT